MQYSSLKLKHLIFGCLIMASVLVISVVIFNISKQKSVLVANQPDNNLALLQSENNAFDENKFKADEANKIGIANINRVEDYPEFLRPLALKIRSLQTQKAQIEKEVARLESEREVLRKEYTDEWFEVRVLSRKMLKAKMRVSEFEKELCSLEIELLNKMQVEKTEKRDLRPCNATQYF